MVKTAERTDLTVERTHLLHAVAQVMPAASRCQSLPILAGIRLQRDGDSLRLTATDLELSISTLIPASCPKKFDVVVHARLLQRLVKEAAGPLTLTITQEPEVDRVTVKWARTVATLTAFPISEWPDTPAQTGGRTFELTAGDVELIRKMANFASRDDARPILTGMYFGPDGVVTTDSYRLGVAHLSSVDIPDKSFAKPNGEGFLVPAAVARFLPMRLLDTETATVTLDDGGSYVTIESAGLTIRACLIHGEFPPYKKLIPERPASRITFNLTDLKVAVRTASIMAIDAQPVRFFLDPGAMRAHVAATNRDVGEVDTEVDLVAVEGQVPPSTSAFNVVYLGELLNMLTEETVTFEMIDALKPMVVREGPLTLLLMPVRVS